MKKPAMCAVATTARSTRFLFAMLALVAAVIGSDAALSNTVTVRDAAGREVAVADASRIVAIGGAVTEILYALGLSERIVAIDTTSLFPASALKEKPNVGYMRALSAEGVLGLNPSLVLAIDGAGPKETVSVLEQAAVPFVRVPDRYTGDGIVEKIKMIAEVTGAKVRGETLSCEVGGDLAEMAKLRAKVTKPRKVMFVISFLNGKPMVAGRNTAADGIIKLAGGVNAMDAYEGYKQIADEAVIAAGPDTVLVMQRPQDNLDAATVFSNAAFSATPAAAQKSFVSMDGLYLLGFGPRTAKAARDLAAQLYPALGREALPSERRPGGCY
jgi:iron complex transport system substrate-binding protein